MNKPCPCCNREARTSLVGENFFCGNQDCAIFGIGIRPENWNKPRQPSEDQQELARTAAEAIKAVAIATAALKLLATRPAFSEYSENLAKLTLEKIQQLSKV